jgi:hypothetical protein
MIGATLFLTVSVALMLRAIYRAVQSWRNVHGCPAIDATIIVGALIVGTIGLSLWAAGV